MSATAALQVLRALCDGELDRAPTCTVTLRLLPGQRCIRLDATGHATGPVHHVLTRPFPHLLLPSVKAQVFQGHVSKKGRWRTCECLYDVEDEAAEGDEPKKKKRRRKNLTPPDGSQCTRPPVYIAFCANPEELPRALRTPAALRHLYDHVVPVPANALPEQLWDPVVHAPFRPRAASSSSSSEPTPTVPPPLGDEKLPHFSDPELWIACERLLRLPPKYEPFVFPPRALAVLSPERLPRDAARLSAICTRAARKDPKLPRHVANRPASAEARLQIWWEWHDQKLGAWSLATWVIAGPNRAAAEAAVQLLRNMVIAAEGSEESWTWRRLRTLVRECDALQLRPGIGVVMPAATSPAARGLLAACGLLSHTQDPFALPTCVIHEHGQAQVQLWHTFRRAKELYAAVFRHDWSTTDDLARLLRSAQGDKKQNSYGVFLLDPSLERLISRVVTEHRDITPPPCFHAPLHRKWQYMGYPVLLVIGAHRCTDDTARVVLELVHERAELKSYTFIVGERFLGLPLAHSAWAAWCRAMAPRDFANFPSRPPFLVQEATGPAPVQGAVFAADPFREGTRWLGAAPFYHNDTLHVLASDHDAFLSAWHAHALTVLNPTRATVFH